MIAPQTIAHILLEKQAVKINFDSLFLWSSGIKSPIYCDNRKILSYPSERRQIVQAFCERIESLAVPCNGIAGVATGGIAWGALVAEQLNLPFLYVRSEPKKHGLGNQIEGELPPNPQLIVIEDLISTGASSIKACIALKEKGASLSYLLSIFEYGFSEPPILFQNHQIPYQALINFQTLIQYASLSENEKQRLIRWIQNPRQIP